MFHLLHEWVAALEPKGLVYSGGGVHYDGDDEEFNLAWAKGDQRRIRDMGASRREAAARTPGIIHAMSSGRWN